MVSVDIYGLCGLIWSLWTSMVSVDLYGLSGLIWTLWTSMVSVDLYGLCGLKATLNLYLIGTKSDLPSFRLVETFFS